MQVWQNLFSIYGLQIGQLLLTRADPGRSRALSERARDTLQTLLHNRIIPVINENDAVAIAEIKVGDNDNLSAEPFWRMQILNSADRSERLLLPPIRVPTRMRH